MPRTKIQKGDSFSALWKCQDMAWANPGIERRLQPWLWRSLSYRRKAQLPSFTAIHHSHHASPCRTCFRSRRTKDYHNSPTNIISTSGGCGNSAVRCTCAACFPSPPTSLFSPVVLRLRTTLLLSSTLLSSPDDAAVSSRPSPSRTSPPPLLLMDCLQPCSSANCSPRTKH